MISRLSTLFRWLLIALMLIAAGIFMLHAARGDSAVQEELANIPAGYSYVKYLDYRLNPENPPLVKILAGLPDFFFNFKFPVGSPNWERDINGQWSLGTQFLYESGNDPDQIIFWSRIGPILLTLLLIIAVYLFSKEFLGRWWALLPTFLTAFSPTLLAHGHYVTTDVAASLGTLVATAAFLSALFRPSKKSTFLAGLAFGFAQLTKFSAFLLVPYFIVLAAAFYLIGLWGGWHKKGEGLYVVKLLFWTFFLGFLLVFIAYGILTRNYPITKQISDSEYLLSSKLVTWLAGVPAARGLAEYILGLLMTIKNVVADNVARNYFPALFLLKEPIASLILIFIAFVFAIKNIVKAALGVIFRRSNKLFDYLGSNFAEFSMMIFVIFYFAISMIGNFNIGIRHILPTLPFIYILTSSAIKKWFSTQNPDFIRNFVIKLSVIYKEVFGVSVKTAIFAFLIILYFSSTAFAAPYFLSYFNILGGGLQNGYKSATDSNYDWGQDLKRFAAFAKENISPGEKIAIEYFGGGDPKYYLGDQAEPWWSAKGSPKLGGIDWFAVSITAFQKPQLSAEDEYRWLVDYETPFARAGTSIFIYKLD